jgi:hypothetical protein
MKETFASGGIGGIGFHHQRVVVQQDNPIAADTGAMDQPGWHVWNEVWLTIRPAVSQVRRCGRRDLRLRQLRVLEPYLVAITALCGPTKGTTRHSPKPTSRIQPMQSSPV